MIEPSARIVTIHCACAGWIALVRQGPQLTLVGCRQRGRRQAISTNPRALLRLARRAHRGEPVATEPASAQTARRALARWVRRASAASLVGAGAGADTALRRAVRRRIDAALRTLPLATRGLAADQWSTVLAALLRQPGAGMTIALRRLLRVTRTPLAFTTALESLAATCAPSPVSPEPGAPHPARLVALVILRNA